MPAKTKKPDIKFGQRDEAKEEKIKKRLGSYLECCPHGLFFYPDDKKAYLKLIRRLTRSIPYQQGILKGIKGAHIIRHIWGTMQKGIDGPKIVTKVYQHKFSWYFGEAEYLGRKSGAKPWETEDKILSDIKKDILKTIPSAEVYMKTKFGHYRIRAYNCKRGDRDKVVRIKEKFQQMYPNDVFYFTYKTKYGRSHALY